MANRLLSVLLLLGLGSLLGCGDGRPERVLVSGTVVIDGEPITQGAIKFVPEGARTSFSLIDKEGRFNMTCYEDADGIVPGKHRVAVTANKALGDSGMEWFAPKKYSDHRTSGLEYTIEEDTPDLRIELTWDGGKPFKTGSKPRKNSGEGFLEE